MEIIKPKVRNMREELRAAGTPRDTDEIRTNTNLDGFGFRIIQTFHDKGDTQNRHAHLLTGGGHQNLAGVIEVQNGNGDWHDLAVGDTSTYSRGEFYNARVPAGAPSVSYPGAGPKTGAATNFYKSWHELDLEEGEYKTLLDYDWFGEGIIADFQDPKASPINRNADEKVKKQFWEIVSRNRSKFDMGCKFAYKPKLDEMIDFKLDQYKV